MMAENPNFWWSLSGKPPLVSQQPSNNNFMSSPPPPPPPPPSSFFPPQYLFGASPPLLPPSSLLHHDHNQDHFPLSWSQLLMGGIASHDQEESGGGTSSSNYGQFKKLESSWEDHQILNNPSSSVPNIVGVKQELDQRRQFIYDNSNHHGDDDELQACSSSWSSQVHPIPSPGNSSCVSNLSVLDFSTNKRDRRNQHSSECNGTSTSGTPAKKARVQPSSSQPPLKVRKEKLGDRITALHQIVSPFGKTDTASVLLEAIGYIRFLEAQIEALSTPYLGNASGTTIKHQHSVKGERKCGINREDESSGSGQLLKDDYQKRIRGASKQDPAENIAANDLRSRGLCLVPVSCTDHIDLGTNNGSDYWAPGLGGGGGVGF